MHHGDRLTLCVHWFVTFVRTTAISTSSMDLTCTASNQPKLYEGSSEVQVLEEKTQLWIEQHLHLHQPSRISKERGFVDQKAHAVLNTLFSVEVHRHQSTRS